MINQKQLRAKRTSKGWTQRDLHERSGIDVQTISRIERGKVANPIAHTIASLAHALGISAEQLTATDVTETDEQSKFGPATSQLNVRIDNANRNALTLISTRYGVQVQRIIELAPLLFAWAAETSLEERRAALARAQAGVDESIEALKALPHLQGTGRDYPQDELDAEEQSIGQRDLFGAKISPEFVWRYEFETDAPFVRFLTSITEKIDGISKFEWWHPETSPDYQLDDAEALEIAGNDPTFTDAIIKGYIPLHEMPRELRGHGHEAERHKWLSDKYAEHLALVDAQAAELFADLEGDA